MQKKHMTPDTLQEFHQYFTNINPEIDIFDDFIYVALDLIDDEENMSFHMYLDKQLNEINFKSEEELTTFGKKYIEFHESIEEFFEMLESIEEDEKIEELISELYYTFQEIDNSDLETFTAKIKEYTIETINVVLDKYDIDFDEEEDVSSEIFEAELYEKIGDPYPILIMTMLGQIDIIENEPEKTDEVTVNTLFSVLMIFIFNMNMKSKQEEIQKINEYEKYKDVSRNDACPCGSGKKYKKCCMR